MARLLDEISQICFFVIPCGAGWSAVSQGFLEMHHHETPFARGGAQTADNLRLACRAHNFFLGERDYGRDFMKQKLMAAVAHRTRFGRVVLCIEGDRLESNGCKVCQRAECMNEITAVSYELV